MYLKKYRFHARKVEDSDHAIYDVWERVQYSLTESRPLAVRRPAPSQIKMYGFCRLFRAMSASKLACKVLHILGVIILLSVSANVLCPFFSSIRI